MSTSGTYLFTSPQSEQIITDAYERIGIVPSPITLEQIQTAQRSMNFILSSWVNKGLNLWTVQEGLLGLQNNQRAYSLPLGVIDWLEAELRQSQRQLGGVPFSSEGGVASNAFDYNPNTACTQTGPNGYISYNWSPSQFDIEMVGVQSNVTDIYTLVFEFSNDNITWTQVGAPPAQTYTQGVLTWFAIAVPTNGSYFRVRETGGATLNIQELYFNTAILDIVINRQSRAEYQAQPNKNQTGQPSTFYINRQISPVAYIWPVPYGNFNCIHYTFIQQMQDVGTMINCAQIPTRFLEAFTAKLAHMLSVKQVKDLAKVQMLGQLAEMEYTIAGQEDRERVPLRVYGDYMQGWSQV